MLLIADAYGHVTFNDPNRCVDDVRTRYLVAPPRGTVCTADKLPFS